MAKLISALRFTGTIDGITYKQTKDGIIACKKTSLDGKRIKTDPKFERTRQNNNEFGYSCKLATVIRHGLRGCWDGPSGKVHGKLVQRIMKGLKLDPVNRWGERKLQPGQLGQLLGFNLNAGKPMSNSFYAQHSLKKSRSNGRFLLEVDPFLPGQSIEGPAAATHFRLVFAVMAADLEGIACDTVSAQTDYLPLCGNNPQQLSLQVTHFALQGKVLLFALGIEFCSMTNGMYRNLSGGRHNSMEIVAIDTDVKQ